MNWIEKIKYLKIRREKEGYNGRYFVDINYESPKWQSDEIEDIIRPHPWLPKSYIGFIKEFDNLGLAFVSFYGSKGVNGIPLKEELAYWREEGLSENYFPFGKDPAGGVFTFNKSGEVIWFLDDDYEFENPQKIADTFEEFVGECLMGKRYAEFNIIEDDPYYDLLKNLGWA